MRRQAEAIPSRWCTVSDCSGVGVSASVGGRSHWQRGCQWQCQCQCQCQWQCQWQCVCECPSHPSAVSSIVARWSVCSCSCCVCCLICVLAQQWLSATGSRLPPLVGCRWLARWLAGWSLAELERLAEGRADRLCGPLTHAESRGVATHGDWPLAGPLSAEPLGHWSTGRVAASGLSEQINGGATAGSLGWRMRAVHRGVADRHRDRRQWLAPATETPRQQQQRGRESASVSSTDRAP